MNITDFATSRNQQPQTISRYISRHSEEFEGHTSRNGKSVDLDEVALNLLDEIYPLPKPITVINGISEEEHHEALREKDDIIRSQSKQLEQVQLQLTNMMNDTKLLNDELTKLRGNERLLEDKQAQINKMNSDILYERQRNQETYQSLRYELEATKQNERNAMQQANEYSQKYYQANVEIQRILSMSGRERRKYKKQLKNNQRA